MPATDALTSRQRLVLRAFTTVAVVEAFTWVGLLTGMYFKYLGTPRTEIGVKVFGMIHGLVFIAFVIAGVLVGMAVRWAASSWLLALLGSIVPLGSVIFIIWAERTGRLGDPGAVATAPPRAEST